jgi:2-amino-4-hydroxy-6-hydroxymethyldihydropteridine diphosphokinase
VTRAVLGLGANLGDGRAALRGALAELAQAPDVVVAAVSGLWRSTPVGGPPQADYWNAVVVVETTLEPEALLALAHRLEAAAGRTRAERWGPRTLDVDVLDVAGERRDEPGLSLPHPRAHARRFVLEPWSQLEPDRPLEPVGGPSRTVAAWAERCAADPEQEVELAEDGTWWR